MTMAVKPFKLPVALRQLPPLPQALARALEIIRDPSSSRSQLAAVLSLDQGLTGLFLRMVNSAYYGLPRRITSIDEAIGYLGFETVESIILAVSTSKLLARPVRAYRLQAGMLWEHSVAVAYGAQWIAQKRNLAPRSEFYVAGLLHDVGKVAMDMLVNPQTGWGAAEESHAGEVDWTEIEQIATGYNHAELGAVVVRSWNLPDRVIEAVACHHQPGQAQVDPLFSAVVHLANVGALMAGIGLGLDGLRHTMEESAVACLAWSQEEMEALMGEMLNSVERAREILSVARS